MNTKRKVKLRLKRKLISARKELVLMLTLHVGKILSYIMPAEDVFKEYSTTPSKSKNLIQYLIVQVAVVQVVVGRQWLENIPGLESKTYLL